MEIIIKERALKELSKLDKSQADKILKAIENLANYPNIQNIKKLKNHTPTYRLKVGNYRVLFDIEEKIIIVGSVRHRKKAYR
jgi:mRNA interferase RelE/StbE